MIFPCLWAAPGVPFVTLKLPNGQQPFYGLLLEKTPQRHRCSNNGKRSFIKITPPPSCSYACSLGQHGSHLSPTTASNKFMRRLLGKTGVLNGHFLACLKWIFGRDKIYSKPNCTSTYLYITGFSSSKLINVFQCILMIFWRKRTSRSSVVFIQFAFRRLPPHPAELF